jgi:hypothetical protein
VNFYKLDERATDGDVDWFILGPWRTFVLWWDFVTLNSKEFYDCILAVWVTACTNRLFWVLSKQEWFPVLLITTSLETCPCVSCVDSTERFEPPRLNSLRLWGDDILRRLLLTERGSTRIYQYSEEGQGQIDVPTIQSEPWDRCVFVLWLPDWGSTLTHMYSTKVRLNACMLHLRSLQSSKASQKRLWRHVTSRSRLPLCVSVWGPSSWPVGWSLTPPPPLRLFLSAVPCYTHVRPPPLIPIDPAVSFRGS